ncbi:hypothetical protein [Cognatishimia activa]|uniref:Uncharacterized protein n=1 Tax=Cognatishimia activa TaxID=1715691 RepID=A0A0P1IPX8_9RHOB|nr:hypothetical protein [Cognatishimia activa]CUI87881.1 hypothetical protein TA5113_01686 [Cognatishimia activa]CUK25625.1 hypothetical protein TA5114_01426 [Cognatishimia activa]
MKRLTISVFALGLMSAPAFANGHCDGDACIVNKGGKVVWTITDLGELKGTNPGGKGRTQNAAGGLTKAADNGLELVVVPADD